MGLGDITINSYLDEPFNAEIELIDVGNTPLTGIQASVASVEEFERMGLERVYALTLLSFLVEKNERGKSVVKIRSQERITDPFLPLLVDLVWAEGQVYRSYTVFLDPPNYQLKLAKRQYQHVVKQQQAKLDAESEAGVVERPVYTQVEHGISADKETHHSTTYGPTYAHETIWQVAQRYKTEDITLQQMILAILGSNPQAFTEGNLNGLKEGSRLQIPASSTASHVPANLAKLEVLAHDKAWHDRGAIEHALLPPYIDAEAPITSKAENTVSKETYASSIPTVSFATAEHSQQTAVSWLHPIHTSGKDNVTVTANGVDSTHEAAIFKQLQILQQENKNLHDMLLKRESELKQLRSRMHLLMARHGVLGQANGNGTKESGSVWVWILLLLGFGGGGGLLYWWLWNRPLFQRKDPSTSVTEETPLGPVVTPSFEEAPRVDAFTTLNPAPVNEIAKPQETTIIETPATSIETSSSEAKTKIPEPAHEPEVTEIPMVEVTPTETSEMITEEENEEATPVAEEEDLEYTPTQISEMKPLTDEQSAEDKTPAQEDEAPLEYIVEPTLEKSEQAPPLATKIEVTTDSEPSADESELPTLGEPDGVKFVLNPVQEKPASLPEPTPEENPLKSKAALGTLLDLAKTYIGMDDLEAAKQSLTEVIKFGDEALQAEAKQLLKTLQEK